MTITVMTKKIYHSSKRGRGYQTLAAAINAEAVEIIKEKHPAEPYEYDTGYGFHWSILNRSDVLLRRVKRLVSARYKMILKDAQNS